METSCVVSQGIEKAETTIDNIRIAEVLLDHYIVEAYPEPELRYSQQYEGITALSEYLQEQYVEATRELNSFRATCANCNLACRCPMYQYQRKFKNIE